MKPINKYLVNRHITKKDVSAPCDFNFDFTDLISQYKSIEHLEKAYPIATKKIKNTISKVNGYAVKHNESRSEMVTLTFKDSWLHVSLYYDDNDMLIYTASLLSPIGIYPDDEWSDCDMRDEIGATLSDEAQFTQFWSNAVFNYYKALITEKNRIFK